MAKKTFTTGEVILQSGIYKTPSKKTPEITLRRETRFRQSAENRSRSSSVARRRRAKRLPFSLTTIDPVRCRLRVHCGEPRERRRLAWRGWRACRAGGLGDVQANIYSKPWRHHSSETGGPS